MMFKEHPRATEIEWNGVWYPAVQDRTLAVRNEMTEFGYAPDTDTAFRVNWVESGFNVAAPKPKDTIREGNNNWLIQSAEMEGGEFILIARKKQVQA